MAKVQETTVRIVRIEYKQERTDVDYGSCLWATFDFDIDKYSMSIMSDCGSYGYRWHATPDSESFMHLMSRIDEGYLLTKIANRTVVDRNETFAAVKEFVERLACETECELDDEGWEEIRGACSERNDRSCYDALVSAVGTICRDHTAYSTYDIAECISMTEPVGAKKIAEVFAKHIQPKIRSIACDERR